MYIGTSLVKSALMSTIHATFGKYLPHSLDDMKECSSKGAGGHVTPGRKERRHNQDEVYIWCSRMGDRTF